MSKERKSGATRWRFPLERNLAQVEVPLVFDLFVNSRHVRLHVESVYALLNRLSGSF